MRRIEAVLLSPWSRCPNDMVARTLSGDRDAYDEDHGVDHAAHEAQSGQVVMHADACKPGLQLGGVPHIWPRTAHLVNCLSPGVWPTWKVDTADRSGSKAFDDRG